MCSTLNFESRFRTGTNEHFVGHTVRSFGTGEETSLGRSRYCPSPLGNRKQIKLDSKEILRHIRSNWMIATKGPLITCRNRFVRKLLLELIRQKRERKLLVRVRKVPRFVGKTFDLSRIMTVTRRSSSVACTRYETFGRLCGPFSVRRGDLYGSASRPWSRMLSNNASIVWIIGRVSYAGGVMVVERYHRLDIRVRSAASNIKRPKVPLLPIRKMTCYRR